MAHDKSHFFYCGTRYFTCSFCGTRHFKYFSFGTKYFTCFSCGAKHSHALLMAQYVVFLWHKILHVPLLWHKILYMLFLWHTRYITYASCGKRYFNYFLVAKDTSGTLLVAQENYMLFFWAWFFTTARLEISFIESAMWRDTTEYLRCWTAHGSTILDRTDADPT